MASKLTHPADALTKALERTANLLAVLVDLYDSTDENFSGGNAFVSHAISTATTLVDEARDAMNDLHFSCDLTLLDHPDRDDIELPKRAHEAPVQSTREAEPVAATRDRQQQDELAQSYLELLKKLTAAEVFAAEQQALSLPGTSQDLLPLLRSLREDLQKIHSAA